MMQKTILPAASRQEWFFAFFCRIMLLGSFVCLEEGTLKGNDEDG
jgi:hypothetical protein